MAAQAIYSRCCELETAAADGAGECLDVCGEECGHGLSLEHSGMVSLRFRMELG